MISQDLTEALTPVVSALESLGISYYIGGSIASSVYGVARSTLDADLAADLKLKDIAPLVEHLQASYYIDREMVEDAVRHHSSFNLIHFATATKIDIFVLQRRGFDRRVLERSRLDTLAVEPQAHVFRVASPEDVILHKLRWYQEGGGVSERQWSDVLGVLKMQSASLDYAYLRHWAGQLGVAQLLEHALWEAGIGSK
jgi:hypothetical protein